MNKVYTSNYLLLKAENIKLSYSSRVILRDINFEVYDIVRPGMIQGQIISVVGKSGIGKTLLLKVLSGLVKPETGSIRVGEDLHPVKEGEMGIVFQNYPLFKHRTIYKNLEIGLKHADSKINSKDRKDIIMDYAQKFELKDQLYKYPSQLSGGQKQRVSIIQQVLTGNRFILLDEPFSGLDCVMIDKVTELLINLANSHEQNTLIIVSHDIINAMAISDTVYIMANESGKDGATIHEKIDLMKLGLAWEPEVKYNPLFNKLISEIKYKM